MRFASLGSGSAGNALLVESDATCLMVDCGFGQRETLRRLARLEREPGNISGVLVTHEHGDHVGGVFPFARRYGLPVWLSHGTYVACRSLAEGVDVRIVDSHQSFRIGAFDIQPYPVPHDAREPIQFVFSDGTRRLGLTDVGHITQHIRNILSGIDALILECNHDISLLAASNYPASLQRRIGGRLGHLDNQAAADLVRQIGSDRLQHLVAAHLSKSNNSPDFAHQAISAALGTADERIGLALSGKGFSWRCIV
ncbi:MAG: MBL fold metallo-hydrolase [Dechloromonas sp.]|nr:MAG: MBL fold metallo-hydrolase [Dechloromonas sp.]